jgi:hypothetical protein
MFAKIGGGENFLRAVSFKNARPFLDSTTLAPKSDFFGEHLFWDF